MNQSFYNQFEKFFKEQEEEHYSKYKNEYHYFIVVKFSSNYFDFKYRLNYQGLILKDFKMFYETMKNNFKDNQEIFLIIETCGDDRILNVIDVYLKDESSDRFIYKGDYYDDCSHFKDFDYQDESCLNHYYLKNIHLFKAIEDNEKILKELELDTQQEQAPKKIKKI